MRRYTSIPVVLILWVLVHLDWHLARSHHHRLSMEWHDHWIVGFIAFFLLVLFSAWKWPERFVGAALCNGVIGLFVGHIGEAWIEALRSHEPLSSELTSERWHAFFQFSLAGLAGLLVGMVLVFGRRRWRRSVSAQRS